jgi:CP family cyanate transporter-like MFS transporter
VDPSDENGLGMEPQGSLVVPGGRKTVLAGGVLLVIAVVLTALNLRPAITSIGPLLGEMRGSLGASATPGPGC